MTNKKHGTLYVGMTSDLVKRVWEHKKGAVEGFTKKYGLHDLVYFENCEAAETAIHREKRLKKYARDAKIKLIEKDNPNWNDLYAQICQ